MKNLSKIGFAALFGFSVLATTSIPVRAFAEETVKEKAQDTGNAAAAKGTKGMNRVKEAVCTEGDAKCAAKKVGHRVNETGDKVSNKAKELNNKANP